MNLSEGILGQILDENKGNEEITNSIKKWKEDYERLKRVDN